MKILQVKLFHDHKIEGEYPEAIQYPDGSILNQSGIGKFPYECIAKDKHPEAMIYSGGHAWSYLVNN